MEWMACLAASWDGKLTAARSEGEWVRLGTDADLRHLFKLRDSSQAILFGASTCRTWPSIRFGSNREAGARPPLHYLLTNSWKLPWEGQLFQQWQAEAWGPIYIVSASQPSEAARPWLEREVIQWLPVEEATPEATCKAVQKHLEAAGVKRLLVEGGGEVVSLCLEAKALTHISLTLTPWLIGGHDTPSLVGGEGFKRPDFPALKNVQVEQLGEELYLSAAICYPTS